MKVGFDAKKAMRNHTGIGNYSRRCIDAVRAAGAATQLFYPQKAVLGELWRNVLQWWDVRRSHIDIYHGLSNELPFGIGWSGVKTVVTIHDLIFLRMPETYGWTQRQILKLKTRYACRKADRIVAVSEMTRRDLIRYYGISPSRIEVVCQSVSDIYRTPLPAARLGQVARQYSLPACYILCVGTIQQRKNQPTADTDDKIEQQRQEEMTRPLAVFRQEHRRAEQVRHEESAEAEPADHDEQQEEFHRRRMPQAFFTGREELDDLLRTPTHQHRRRQPPGRRQQVVNPMPHDVLLMTGLAPKALPARRPRRRGIRQGALSPSPRP